MPALQSVQLTDRAATPVTYTLVPTGGPKGSVGRVAVADASGNLLSEKALTISGRRTAQRLRSSIKLAVPIIANEMINGVSVPKVVRVGYASVEFSFALNSTEQERNDIVGMFQSAFATTKVLIHDTVVKGQTVWGT